MLIDAGLINDTQLEQALFEHKASELKLGEYLIKNGIVTENSIVDAIAEQTKIKKFNPNDYSISSDLSKLMDIDTVNRFRTIPLEKKGGVLTVAMVDPLDIIAIDYIEILTNMEVEAVIITEQSFTYLLSSIFGAYAGRDGVMQQVQDIIDMDAEDAEDSYSGEIIEATLQDMADDAPVIKFVNSILAQAVRDKASDMHLSPEKDYVQLRYRVDGKLHDVPPPPKKMFMSIVSRLKILANLDISVSRIPQDGRFTVKLQDKEINIRVSTMPTIYGENIVLRLLDVGSMVYSLENMGMSLNNIKMITKMLKKPYGMILATGPTGSGKSSTLFAMMKIINTPDRNIVTLEDPVEYRMENIRQAQLNKKAGMTFASGLKSIMRQDPDVIMVGEIRDYETASVAVQAALTGHMVFSSVHTNDAAGAIARLVDMGIEPFLVSSVMLITISQRLVRRVCPECKELYQPLDKELDSWGFTKDTKGEFVRAKGCYNCMDTGYKGRIGLYEVLYIDTMIQDLILQKTPSKEISDIAQKAGRLITLRMDAALKVKSGITTMGEAALAIMT